MLDKCRIVFELLIDSCMNSSSQCVDSICNSVWLLCVYMIHIGQSQASSKIRRRESDRKNRGKVDLNIKPSMQVWHTNTHINIGVATWDWYFQRCPQEIWKKERVGKTDTDNTRTSSRIVLLTSSPPSTNSVAPESVHLRWTRFHFGHPHHVTWMLYVFFRLS